MLASSLVQRWASPWRQRQRLFRTRRRHEYPLDGADIRTRSLAALLSDDPGMLLHVAGAAFAGLVAAIFYLRRHWPQPTGWLVLGSQLMGWLILGWQIRGTTLATALGIPFGPWPMGCGCGAPGVSRESFRPARPGLRWRRCRVGRGGMGQCRRSTAGAPHRPFSLEGT